MTLTRKQSWKGGRRCSCAMDSASKLQYSSSFRPGNVCFSSLVDRRSLLLIAEARRYLFMNLRASLPRVLVLLDILVRPRDRLSCSQASQARPKPGKVGVLSSFVFLSQSTPRNGCGKI